MHTFFEILNQKKYDRGIFINFGKGSLTADAKKKLKNKKVDIFENVLTQKKTDYSHYTLYPHQQEAVQKAIAHYQKNDRGLLNMACGTGKNLVAKEIMKRLLPKGGIIFYFVPWINLLEQSSFYFNDPDILSIPICSKDKDIIKKYQEKDLFENDMMDFSNFLDELNWQELKKDKDYKYLLFFCTYQSNKKLAEKQKEWVLPPANLMICDEAHHTNYKDEISKVNKQNNKNKNKEKEINQFESLHKNIKFHKVLFMTTTVKILYKNKNEIINYIFKKIFLQCLFLYERNYYSSLFSYLFCFKRLFFKVFIY